MQRKKLSAEERRKREEKRERRAARPAETAPAEITKKPTLAQLVDRQDLERTISKSTTRLIRDTEVHVDEYGKTHLKVSSCIACAAPKGCCSLRVGMYLHEAVPLVARLRREGRDTPELREQLAMRAERMETPGDYRVPCAFLNEDERCTVYPERPIECGTTFVFSPAPMCSDPTATSLDKFRTELGDAPRKMEQRFERDARLVPLPGLYMGVLPRMVLLCLEAWEREDYAQYLADEMPNIARRMLAVMGR